ncbi:MAG TPA: NAD(P)/FAD-dependent oxidoreductase [Chloroflexi bacterium]|jgi:phytoene dehydrogenase-like protein|nr:NAD(P)/FAD-dependent oxidoreductase [Chloroflexota bacterium]
MTEEKAKVVIVGAGMAGLTAAAYLMRENYDVLLLDKNDKVGGLLQTFRSNDFSFDSGPRAFVNSGIMKPMLKDLEIDWDFLENKISIGVEDQIFRVDSMDSLKEYEKLLINLYPESADDVKKIIPIMNQLSKYTGVLYEFDNPNFTANLMADKKFVFKKLIPWTFKFLNALRKFNQFKMPMEPFMAELTDNQSLIDILIQHFFRETPTYFALGYFYVYFDYFYPKGGTASVVDLLKNKVLDGGGEIQLNKQIVAVNPAESTVTDSTGESYSYDHLIWAADLKSLYRYLNPAGLDAEISAKVESESQAMLSAKGAESVFILFLAVDRPTSYFETKGGEHMFYTPSRKGLGQTNRLEREKLVKDFSTKSKAEVLEWVDQYCALNTYEVSIPALRDAAMAPEGKTGLMISCLLDYDVVEKIEQAGWYAEFKGILEERIISIFSQSIYPDLAEDILFKFSSTPLTIQQYSGSSEGAITGWSFEGDVPVVNKLADIPKSVLTPIPNILQAGQWAYSPAGVPIAMMTGWYATQKILKDSKQSRGK